MARFQNHLSRRVTVRFTDDQYRELEEIAVGERFHVSEVVRSVMLGFLRQRRKLEAVAGDRL
ncbi:hypothetical protein [Trichlorobacter ammonificans]|uniref:Ribbon-helix-helix protein CopG domain-containing protein n=1 Tax=Trichlorobacter ammonificans TaxID=2916410 RepID=A0ABM9D7R9_9BACT|nr:hypothetical protein [Trichlorobacter ammonificans]CAH2031259.1 protein of unknown function [Trichlorobacter ammonificans]